MDFCSISRLRSTYIRFGSFVGVECFTVKDQIQRHIDLPKINDNDPHLLNAIQVMANYVSSKLNKSINLISPTNESDGISQQMAYVKDELIAILRPILSSASLRMVADNKFFKNMLK